MGRTGWLASEDYLANWRATAEAVPGAAALALGILGALLGHLFSAEVKKLALVADLRRSEGNCRSLLEDAPFPVLVAGLVHGF